LYRAMGHRSVPKDRGRTSGLGGGGRRPDGRGKL
jgi:hypothetical protein